MQVENFENPEKGHFIFKKYHNLIIKHGVICHKNLTSGICLKTCIHTSIIFYIHYIFYLMLSKAKH